MKLFWPITPILLAGLFTVCCEAKIYPAKQVNLVVAADGSGDLKTVQGAIDKIPVNNRTRFVILIKPGIYREQIKIPATKPFVSLIGESAANTRLTFNLSNKDAGTTSASYSFYVAGHDFRAENLTFENSFGAGSQAVAVLTEADRLVFRKCRFLGWQDTLYAKDGRQYFEDCYIEGAVDFIFGEAAAVFENCEIHSKGDGYITAPMRFSADEPAGFVFIKSKLTGANTQKGVFLGRPWRDYGRTVFLKTVMGAHIRPEGWNNWLAEREKTAYFAEFKSSGAGAHREARVKWAHQLTATEAQTFLPKNFLKKTDHWNPKNADSAKLKEPNFQAVTWQNVLKQAKDWYATDEAARVADQVELYQRANGGWPKNIEMAAMLTNAEKQKLLANKTDATDAAEATIDNGTTLTQLRFLAESITASLAKPAPPNNFEKHKAAFFKGLDYLFTAQYRNGGFPQYFPLRQGYYSHLTNNDDAMIGVLELLRDIAEQKPQFRFVDAARRATAAERVSRGIHAILKTQVVVKEQKTVWCAQHDEITLAPAPARAFEPVSLSGYESIGIVRFLMSLENPSSEIIDAVKSAVAWFQKSKIDGIKIITKPDNSPRGFDRIVVADKTAAPVWARFYEIETNRPIFTGRDSVIRYHLAEIEQERRTGYNYYTAAPAVLLNKDYPNWLQKIEKISHQQTGKFAKKDERS